MIEVYRHGHLVEKTPDLSLKYASSHLWNEAFRTILLWRKIKYNLFLQQKYSLMYHQMTSNAARSRTQQQKPSIIFCDCL